MLEAGAMPISRIVRVIATPSDDAGATTRASTEATSDESRTQRYAHLVVDRYASVVSLDQFGKEVPVVVWVAPYAGRLLIWAAAGSPLVGRIRANPEIRIAPCDEQGRLLADPTTAAARILFPEETPTVSAAMLAKYGWRFRLVRAAGRLGRLLFIRPRGYLGIELTLS